MEVTTHWTDCEIWDKMYELNYAAMYRGIVVHPGGEPTGLIQ